MECCQKINKFMNEYKKYWEINKENGEGEGWVQDKQNKGKQPKYISSC